MTIHDIGFDHTYFNSFKSSSIMVSLKDRFKWLHIDLPGQEAYAKDFKSKY